MAEGDAVTGDLLAHLGGITSCILDQEKEDILAKAAKARVHQEEEEGLLTTGRATLPFEKLEDRIDGPVAITGLSRTGIDAEELLLLDGELLPDPISKLKSRPINNRQEPGIPRLSNRHFKPKPACPVALAVPQGRLESEVAPAKEVP
jgi:hypothetical protein